MLLKEYAAMINRLVALGNGNAVVCRAGESGMHEVVTPPAVERGAFQRYDPEDLSPALAVAEAKYISLDG